MAILISDNVALFATTQPAARRQESGSHSDGEFFEA
jgi:hypothetical protein